MTIFRFSGTGKAPVKVNKVTAEISSNSQAVSGRCVFAGVIVFTDGSNDVTISIYNGTDNTGAKVIPSGVVVPAASRLISINAEPPIGCPNGIYVEIAGTGGKCQVIYDN